MASFTSVKSVTRFWIVMTDYGSLGVGSSDIVMDRDAAKDEFSDRVARGYPSRVMRVDIVDSTSQDITREMLLEIKAWYEQDATADDELYPDGVIDAFDAYGVPYPDEGRIRG